MTNEDLENTLNYINKLTTSYGEIKLDYITTNFYFIEKITSRIDRIIFFNKDNFDYELKDNIFYLLKENNIYISIVQCLGFDFHILTLNKYRKKSGLIYYFANEILPHYAKMNINKTKKSFRITFKNRSLATKIKKYIKMEEILYLTNEDSFEYKIRKSAVKKMELKEKINEDFIKYLSINNRNHLKEFLNNYGKISTVPKTPNIFFPLFVEKLNKIEIKKSFETYNKWKVKKINNLNYTVYFDDNRLLKLKNKQQSNTELKTINYEKELEYINNIKDNSGELISIRYLRKKLLSNYYIEPYNLYLFCAKNNIELYDTYNSQDIYQTKNIPIDNLELKVSFKKVLKEYIKECLKKEKYDIDIEIKKIIQDFKKYYEEEEKIKYISMEKLKNYFKNNEYKENILEYSIIIWCIENKKQIKLPYLSNENIFNDLTLSII